MTYVISMSTYMYSFIRINSFCCVVITNQTYAYYYNRGMHLTILGYVSRFNEATFCSSFLLGDTKNKNVGAHLLGHSLQTDIVDETLYRDPRFDSLWTLVSTN